MVAPHPVKLARCRLSATRRSKAERGSHAGLLAVIGGEMTVAVVGDEPPAVLIAVKGAEGTQTHRHAVEIGQGNLKDGTHDGTDGEIVGNDNDPRCSCVRFLDFLYCGPGPFLKLRYGFPVWHLHVGGDRLSGTVDLRPVSPHLRARHTLKITKAKLPKPRVRYHRSPCQFPYLLSNLYRPGQCTGIDDRVIPEQSGPGRVTSLGKPAFVEGNVSPPLELSQLVPFGFAMPEQIKPHPRSPAASTGDRTTFNSSTRTPSTALDYYDQVAILKTVSTSGILPNWSRTKPAIVW